MACIIGLDLSLTSTGVLVLDGKSVLSARAIQSNKIGEERLFDLREQLYAEVEQYRFSNPLAVVEGYSMGSRAGQAFSIGEWGGVARLTLLMHGIPFIVVPPSTLKKFTAGSGNAKKDEMRLHVYKKWGFEHKSNDVVDAYALARFGEAYLAVKEGRDAVEGWRLTKADFDVVDKFIKGQEKEAKAG